MSLSVGFSIPAYENEKALRRCLESIHRVVPSAEHLVVVDDSGQGSLRAALGISFPSVRWITHSENRGFGPSANEAVRANEAEIVILLNDDVELLENPLPIVLKAFENDQLFAASLRSVDGQGNFREGAKRLVWRFGYPRILHNESDQLPSRKNIYPTSYAVGGHVAFHRGKFVELGGFDPLFEPFYWEDVDLSQRAIKKGWECTYSPECTVRHSEGSAIRSVNRAEFVKEITERNRLIFAWRHATPSQRRLLNVTLPCKKVAAKLTLDTKFLHAVESARQRWKEFTVTRPSSGLVPIPGARVGQ